MFLKHFEVGETVYDYKLFLVIYMKFTMTKNLRVIIPNKSQTFLSIVEACSPNLSNIFAFLRQVS